MWSFNASWRIFPLWLKKLMLFVGLPAWLGFAAMIFTGALFEYKGLTLSLFAVLGLLAFCQTFFIARAAWRNEL
ncbi:hypothetical protein [Sphingobium sp. AP50]|uniref:hypothetical protein n=1 Tax=Sphingobium sp. AP50 TaxID=1884369 RepID=UPI000B86E074|nr:hypothetical protein [Sphingobium sp. AP50]